MENAFIKDRYLASLTPKEQVYALLDRAVSYMGRAKTALEQSSYEEANNLLLMCQEIFIQLRGCLRGQDAASRRGAALLELLTDELFYINLNKETARLEEVRVLTKHLQITYGAQMGKLRFE